MHGSGSIAKQDEHWKEQHDCLGILERRTGSAELFRRRQASKVGERGAWQVAKKR